MPTQKSFLDKARLKLDLEKWGRSTKRQKVPVYFQKWQLAGLSKMMTWSFRLLSWAILCPDFRLSSKPVLPGKCKHPSLIHFCSIPNASEVQLKSSQQPVLPGKCPGGNTLVSTGTTGNGFSEWTQLPFEPKSKLTRGDSILVSMQWQPHTLWVNGKKFLNSLLGNAASDSVLQAGSLGHHKGYFPQQPPHLLDERWISQCHPQAPLLR